MSFQYLKNHMGMKLNDEQMQEIPNPYTELITHVFFKNVQAFGMLGTLIVGPLNAVRKASTRNLAGVIAKSTKAGKYGVMMSVVTAPLMTYATVKGDDVERVVDRCYRLRHHRCQVRVDQASILGSVAGVAVGVSQGNPTFGALVGMTSGLLAATAYNRKKNKLE